MKPKKLTKEKLLLVLDDIVASIKADDSFEGRIDYSCLEGDCNRGEFMVSASYRVGNSMGQGGCSIVGEPET